MLSSITDIPGIRVGSVSDLKAITGCTVVLCEKGAVAGVDIRGGAPGTRETDCLRPMHLVERVHALCLVGGSAFGLEAASGVMQYLEEKGIGLCFGEVSIPIVPAAVIFDLGIGSYKVRPDKKMGYQACLNARGGKIKEGSVGAGCGATVGKLYGLQQGMKGGLATTSINLSKGVIVSALVVVNAFGDIIDEKGEILAGARDPQTNKFINTTKKMFSEEVTPGFVVTNTTLGVVATNVKLNKEEINKVAQMAQSGLARAISPSHTLVDGDTIFALSYGERSHNLSTIGAAAAEAVARAIRRAVKISKSLGGIPSLA